MKKFTLPIALLLVIFVLAGCAGGGGGSSAGGTSSGGSSGSSSGGGGGSETAAGRTDLNLRTAIQIQTVDPSQTRTEENIIVLDQVFEGLYRLNESKGGYELAVAKSCDISDDGLVYTFKLRDGITFHNGDPIKGSDVVFSFDRFINAPIYLSYTEMVEKVEAPDDSTVVVTLDRPYAPIYHSFHCIKIMSEKEVTEQGSAFGTKATLAGSGPYMLDTFQTSSAVVLKSFPNYFQGKMPIETVNFIPILDNAAAVVAFENGEIDWLRVPMADWDTISSSEKYNTEIIPGNWSAIVAVNYLRNEILGNQKVREAMAHAVNREDVNLALFEGYGTPTWDYMPSQYVVAAPTEYTKYDYDPEKAKALLAEAGYPNGVNIGKILSYGPVHDIHAQVLQANFAAVGITSEVLVLEPNAAFDLMLAQDYDVALFSDYGNYDFNNFRQMADSRSVGMYVVKYEGDVFDWKRFDFLCDEGARLTNLQDRIAVYTELYDTIMKSATLYPTVHSPVANAWAKDLTVVNTPSYYSLVGWHWNN